MRLFLAVLSIAGGVGLSAHASKAEKVHTLKLMYDLTCAQVLSPAALFRPITDETPGLYEQVPAHLTHRKALFNLFVNETERLRISGYHPLSASIQAASVLQLSAYSDPTVRELDAAYRIQATEAKYLTKVVKGPMTQVTAEEIGLVAEEGELADFLERFTATSTPIWLLTTKGAKEYYRDEFIRENLNEIRFTTPDELMEVVSQYLLFARAVYYRGNPGKILKRVDLNGPSARADVAHEMAHAIQEVEWNDAPIRAFAAQYLPAAQAADEVSWMLREFDASYWQSKWGQHFKIPFTEFDPEREVEALLENHDGKISPDSVAILRAHVPQFLELHRTIRLP